MTRTGLGLSKQVGHISSMTVDRRRLLASTAALGAAGFLATAAPRFASAQDATPTTVATLPTGEAGWIKFNLNTVTSDQILSIPGAGEQMTHEFDEYRPWTTIGQFRAEIGKYVDNDVVAGYEKYVFVPVDPTNPDADTFAQLPGLDSDEAKQLADSGPYADDAAFITALGSLVSAEQAGLASAFLASTAAPEATWVKYDLNQITSDQILSIPGAGEQMTHEFDEYRPWTTIGQFRAEIGKYVGDDVVAGYEKYVFVPVSPNDADADTLMQLPGVDEDKANALIGSRPYADNTAFLTALGGQVSAEQAEAAAAFLATS
jgi:DNA uptake protein ComE-like DNA-binding protein